MTIKNPKPGTRYPSAIEPSGYWTVPMYCVEVRLDNAGRPVQHVIDKPRRGPRARARGRA